MIKSVDILIHDQSRIFYSLGNTLGAFITKLSETVN